MQKSSSLPVERLSYESLPRIFTNTFKSLSKSTSLPALPLTTRFTCNHCEFANNLLPPCPQCAWSSEEVSCVFVDCIPRYRRQSTPTRVFWDPKLPENKDARLLPLAATYIQGKSHGRTPITANIGAQNLMATSKLSWVYTPKSPYPLGDPVSNRYGLPQGLELKGTVTDRQPNVTITTVPHTLQASTKYSFQEDHQLEASYPISAKRHFPLFLHHKSILLFNKMEHPSSKLPRSFSSPIHLDLPGRNPIQTSRPSSPTHEIPQRILRHKKGMRYLRVSFATHQGPDGLSAQSCNEGTVVKSLITGDAHAHPIIRLGHPSRPYYSAIRKNMLRPISPFDNSSRASSPSTSSDLPYPARLSLIDSDDSDDQSDIFPRSSSPFAPAVSGFSLSGETEMRMALARQSKGRNPAEHSEYSFLETSRARETERKNQVKRLSKGIKNLIWGIRAGL